MAVPNDNFMRQSCGAYMQNIFSWLKYQIRRRTKKREIDLAQIQSGDIIIDCGANVGDMTSLFAITGATVFSFEPDPLAFEYLSSRMKEYANVKCINKAVLDREGIVKLYFRADRSENPLVSTQGSSVEAGKANIDQGNFIEVDAIDLSDFVLGLPKPVSILKMDVEGAEVAIISSLLETGALQKIERVYVETHERKIPSMVEPLADLKKRLTARGITHVDLNWI